ncbi:hypothetical protein ACROYT_G002002 [Oculina patagonica]
MYISAICVIFFAFHILSARSGLITEKLKLSQASAVCPPGVWTCSTGKRSEIARVQTLRRTENSYPSGIWTRDENEEPRHLNDSENPEDCPPGMWVCKKKRMLKQMLKTALMKSSQDGRVTKLNPSQASNDACPPGVWTCSTGKRSEIIKEAQGVTIKATVLNEPSFDNTAKEDTSLRHVQKDARKPCPPGMWASAVCPPGVWTCSTGKRSEIPRVETLRCAENSYPSGIWTRDENEEPSHLIDSEKPEDCPPGMWVCKKKRMLKQMLKIALMKSSQDGRVAKFNPFQTSNDACPPGVWTCSTGKRSEIIKEAQGVTIKATVLNEPSFGNTAKEDSSLRHVQKDARKPCPPGMWVCDEMNEN